MTQGEAIAAVQARYHTTLPAARAAVHACQELGGYEFAADSARLICTYSNGMSSRFRWDIPAARNS